MLRNGFMTAVGYIFISVAIRFTAWTKLFLFFEGK